MATLSEEQRVYVTSDFAGDTKLLATAGSGKTFCIIKRIEHLVKHNVYSPLNVFMLTFSKNAKDDFRRKVVKYGAQDCMFRENVYTIDSFAWHVFGEEIAKRIDVSLLSYALMDELQTRTTEDLMDSYPLLRALKCVFVDEAQDLNDVQYNILRLFKHHLGAALSVHMVGDPNQNIYQFRAASDKYLTGFEARTFRLTMNYRSFAHIVDFCSHLRPYNDAPCTASHDKPTKMSVTFYAYDSHTVFEKSLIAALQSLVAKKVPLHKCAILAPTRGYIRNPFGVARYRGLCYIANILYNHKIAFSQFYTDTAEDDFFESGKIKYAPTKDHINLMTYTASKGLEWDYVVLVDANAFLISRMGYDADKYAAEQYLLYVASSRARKNLMIFSRARYCNPWFKEVPVEQYRIAKSSLHLFGFFDESQLYNNNSNNSNDGNNLQTQQQSLQTCVHSPYSVVSCLNMAQLYKINKLLEDRVATVQLVDASSSTLVQNNTQRNALEQEARRDYSKQFLTHLFFVHLVDGCLDEAHPFVVDIHNLVTQTNVVVCPNERALIWYFENRNAYTWDLFNARRGTIDQRVVAFIDAAFSKDRPFHSYTLVDRFHDMYLNSSMDFIRQVYESYKQQPKNVETLLHMTRVCYAIKTTHYFYVKQHDAFFTETASEPEELLGQVQRTVDALRREFGSTITCQLNKYCRQEELNMFFFHNVVAGMNFDARSKHSLSIRYLLRGLLRHVALTYNSSQSSECEFLTLQVQPLALYKTTIHLSRDDIECLLACITHASRST